MKHFATIALAVGILSGCSGATPTAAPTTAQPAAQTQPASTAATQPPSAGPMTSPTTPAASAEPTSTPRTTYIPKGGHDKALAMTVTLPATGWTYDDIALGFGKGTDVNNLPEATVLLWSFPAGTEFWVYGDPCQWQSTRPDTPVTTADAIVAGLASQSSRAASAPQDISVDGYAGKSIILHVPDDAVFSDCEDDLFASYGVTGDEPTRYHQGPGQIDEFWVVGVDGAMAVIDATYRSDTAPEVVEEMRSIAQSIVFEAPSEPSPSPAGRTLVMADIAERPVGITVTMPSFGWSGETGGLAAEWGPDGFDPPGGAGIIVFAGDDGEFFAYGDPCNWLSTRPKTPATTVDELVAALANQASRDASEAESFTTVDGYAGKKITLNVPDDAAFSTCDEGTFATFGEPGHDPALYAQGPGEIDEMWIVDVNGRLGILEGGYYPGTPQRAVDELHAILSSATFD